MTDEIPSFRMVLIGDAQVGKTSILTRFLRNQFTDDMKSTIGAVFESYKTEFNGNKYCAKIFDTAGQEKYKSIGPIYYRDTAAAIAVFDMTNRNSLENLQSWIQAYHETVKDGVVFIAGNKLDLVENPEDERNYAMEFIDKHFKCNYYFCSAKTGEGVEEVFTSIIQESIKRGAAGKDQKVEVKDIDQQEESGKNGCC